MSAVRRQRQAVRAGGGETGSAGASRLRAIEAALWLLVAVLLAWRVTPQLRAAVGASAAGPDAPAVTFTMLGRGPLELRALRSRVVLVNFWASWCPPCRAEMPAFERVYAQRRAAGFTIVGVSTDERPPAAVAAFLHDLGITYPVALATPDVVARFGGVNTLPTSFLLDRRGRVRYTVRGVFDEAALQGAIDRLLAEGE